MSDAEASDLARLIEALPEELKRRALTHASWVEDRSASYERLAFLGDSVLGLVIASELFERRPEADSGQLTKVHNQAVSGRACAEVAAEVGLPEVLASAAPEGLGLSVEALASSERPLAEAMEAAIGACHLAHGFEATRAAVSGAFGDQVERAERERLDFKSELQEVLARSGKLVAYEVVREDGPAHRRLFEVTASVDGDTIGRGEGRSKKEAEQAAAEVALEGLRR